MGRFESFNFDFCVVNFDTMKLIFSAKVLETLMPQGFSDKKKERKLQYLWYHNFRSYMVEATGCGCPVDTSVHSTEAPTEAAAENEPAASSASPPPCGS